jgi:hypothetical protein
MGHPVPLFMASQCQQQKQRIGIEQKPRMPRMPVYYVELIRAVWADDGDRPILF